MTDTDSSTFKKKGQYVSRYEILAQLGVGGMGVVYKAHDPNLNKNVGLKVMKSKNLDDSLQIRFQNEAKSLKDLRHRGIPEIYNFAISRDDEPYLVLEYIDGDSLSQLIEERGQLEILEVLDIFIPAGETLAYAHSNGVVHRDIKPDNILLTKDGNGNSVVKIIDFGLAKLEDELRDSQDMTIKNKILGSPPYMSPEQIRNQKTEAATDIYSLGCTLFQAICGRPPYIGETALETISMHLSHNIEVELDKFPDLANTLYSIIQKCCQKEISDRYQNANDLIEALKALQSELLQDSLDEDNPKTIEPPKLTDSNNAYLRPTLLIFVLLIICAAFAHFLYSIKNDISAGKLETMEEISIKRTESHWVDFTQWNNFPIRGKGAYSGTERTNDEGFKQLQSKPYLKTVYSMISSKVTGEGLKYLKDTKVIEVNLYSEKINDSVIHHAKNLNYLKKLSIGNTKKLTATAMKELPALKGLMVLSFHAVTLPPNTIDEIVNLKKLKVLTLGGCKPVRIEDLKKLKALPNLEVLLLDNAQLDKKDLTSLKDLKRLRFISLVNLNLNDKDIAAISNQSLQGFDLSNNSITAKTLTLLSKRKNLELVRAGHCKLIDRKYFASLNLNLGRTIFLPVARSFNPFNAPVDDLELKY